MREAGAMSEVPTDPVVSRRDDRYELHDGDELLSFAVYAELGARIPRAGGDYQFLSAALNVDPDLIGETVSVAKAILPSLPIASRALTPRFIRTWSSWL